MVEETVVEQSTTIKDADGKVVDAPKEITDDIQTEQTEGDKPLFNEKGQQLGDRQLFAVKAEDYEKKYKDKDLTQVVKTTFTVKVNKKPVASLTITATQTLNKTIIDTSEGTKQIKEEN